MRFLAIACIGCLTACASGPSDFPPDSALRSLPGGPAVLDAAREGPIETCFTPMRDPATGTEVLLFRSIPRYGDYQVPAGEWGIGPDELLRVECATGRVLGAVPRD